VKYRRTPREKKGCSFFIEPWNFSFFKFDIPLLFRAVTSKRISISMIAVKATMIKFFHSLARNPGQKLQLGLFIWYVVKNIKKRKRQ
jgi:hypothetical protein